VEHPVLPHNSAAEARRLRIGANRASFSAPRCERYAAEKLDCYAPPEEVFAFLKKAHDEFQPLSVEIRFDKNHALHSHVMALYGSIIELTVAR